jgi:hypothetical protein
MNVKHAPRFDTEKIEKMYTGKDGVPVTYVCTTDLSASDSPFDIFYRETPHPEFGNRYFGIGYSNGNLVITNADRVESYDFGMIQDIDGDWWYSQSHHDCRMIEDKMIDGGRVYMRGNDFSVFKVKDGKFVSLAKSNGAVPISDTWPFPMAPESDSEKS